MGQPPQKTGLPVQLVFSTNYSSQFQNIKNIISKHLPALHSNDSYKAILERGVRYVARRAQTTGNMISPSMYTSKHTTRTWLNTTGLFKCGTMRCSTCNSLGDPHIIISCSNGLSLTTKQLVNCRTRYILYVITCMA